MSKLQILHDLILCMARTGIVVIETQVGHSGRQHLDSSWIAGPHAGIQLFILTSGTTSMRWQHGPHRKGVSVQQIPLLTIFHNLAQNTNYFILDVISTSDGDGTEVLSIRCICASFLCQCHIRISMIEWSISINFYMIRSRGGEIGE